MAQIRTLEDTFLRVTCECCTRQRPLLKRNTRRCWECSGRPSSWSRAERKTLGGLRDPACPHDLPDGA